MKTYISVMIVSNILILFVFIGWFIKENLSPEALPLHGGVLENRTGFMAFSDGGGTTARLISSLEYKIQKKF